MSSTEQAAGELLWSRMRGAHAGASTYRARASARGGRRGQEESKDRVACALTYAAGRRLLFQTDPLEAGTTDRARAGAAVWGHGENYFAWRPAAGLEELGPDFEGACARCDLAVPRMGEILRLLSGLDPREAAPTTSAAEEITVSSLSQRDLLTWRAAGGRTLWQAEVRKSDAALLSLRSEVDPSFDVQRAVEDSARRSNRTQVNGDERARLEAALLEERERGNWFELRIEPELDVELEQDVFHFAPPV